MRIKIIGHTNTNCRDDSFCNELSKRRALSVKEYLVRQGVKASRIDTLGKGRRARKYYDEANKNKNQRVEIKILSMGNKRK